MVENYIKWSEATEPEENKEKYLWYNEGVCKVWNGYMWVVVNQDINVIAEELVPLTIARKTDLINMLRNLSIESIDGNIDWIDDLRDAIAEKLDKSEFEEFKNGLNNQLNGIDIRLGRLENGEGGSGSGPDQTRIDALEERIGNAEENIIDLDRRVTVLENTSGGGSTPGEQGDPGRSVTSIDSYYKLSDLKVGEETPALSIADPTIAGWSKTSSSPTEALPYLWCFWQVNYDKALPSGYTYTRNSAFILRSYASGASADVAELERRIKDLEDSLNEDGAAYNALFEALLNKLREEITQFEDNLAGQIDDLNERLDQIDGSDVALIRDNDKGLWGVLTSYQDSDDPQKASFADIVANAQNAEITLKTGSHFFGLDESGYPHGGESATDITLNGLGLEIGATKTELNNIKNQIDGATFEVNPELIQSAVSKGTLCWEDKDGVLRPYNWHMDTGDGDENDRFIWPPEEDTENKLFFVEYEKYMIQDPENPSSQPCPSDGPFTRKVILDEFSHISQTADEIEATVTKFQYMWKDRDSGDYFNYNHFEDAYKPVKDNYDNYEDFVERYYNNQYEKVEIGPVLSAVTQTAESLRSIIGDAKSVWERQIDGSPREYKEYAVPEDETREQYEARMRRAGWALKTYAESLSVIEQDLDSITLYLEHKVQVWVLKEDEVAAEGEEYSYPYDYWKSDYEDAQTYEEYENYVSRVHSKYELVAIADSISRIKQTVDDISVSVEKIDGIETKLGDLSVRADGVDISASKNTKVLQLKDTEPITQRPYDYYYSDFTDTDPSDKSSEKYEEWLSANHPEYEVVTLDSELGAIMVETGKITQALYKDGNIAASIELLRDLDTDKGKIVLSSTKVEIDADLLEINGETFANAVKSYGIQVGTFDDEGHLITNNPELGYAILSSEGLQASGAIISGKITATSGFIGNLCINEDGSMTNGNFTLSSDGILTATNANIGGKITADEGKIGGFNILGGAIFTTKHHFEDDNSAGVWFADDGLSLGSLSSGQFKAYAHTGHVYASSIDLAGGTISGPLYIDGGSISVATGGDGTNIDENGVSVTSTGGRSARLEGHYLTLRNPTNSLMITADQIVLNNSKRAVFGDSEYVISIKIKDYPPTTSTIPTVCFVTGVAQGIYVIDSSGSTRLV